MNTNHLLWPLGRLQTRSAPPCLSASRSAILCLALLAFGSTSRAAAPAPAGVSTSDHAHQPSTLNHQPAAPAPAEVSSSDWASIRAAYEANRHAAFAIEGGHQARNPGQQWKTKFDGCGFTTQPDKGGWQWGLELRAYGFGDRKRMLEGSPEVKAEGQRVTYVWDENVQEWFVNDQRGLEHGFTVAQRPPGTPEPGAGGSTFLVFDLIVRGPLKPQVANDGQGVSFTDDKGNAVVTYAGLKVWDADGKALPAHLEIPSDAAGNSVRLSVDERDARYPLTIDPVAQQAFLKASNAGRDDTFGSSVAISGDTVVVGAKGEASNGNPSDNSADRAGAAYVFVRSGGNWTQQAYLKASNTEASDGFGTSVGVSGDIIVVGAPGEDGNGLNGDEGDNSAEDAGAVYAFVRNGTTWTQEAYLKASNPDAFDEFGVSVALSALPNSSDILALAGAYAEDSSATGVNGNQGDNNAPDAGAAYVFVRTFVSGLGVLWLQQAYLKASNTEDSDRFGSAVSISGETAVVGADTESSDAIGVNGDQGNNNAGGSGAGYVFRRTGNTWDQEAYLKASNTTQSDTFGASVSVSGATVVVGAPRQDFDAGAAYVFQRNEQNTWGQQAYLKASNSNSADAFGYAVAVSGDTAVVGARFKDFVFVAGRGAAYVFIRSRTAWREDAYFQASNATASLFGEAVAVAGDTVVIGGPGDSSIASGSGAAYIFTNCSAPHLGYSSTPKFGEKIDFGDRFRGVYSLTLRFGNTGDTDLQIESIEINAPHVTFSVLDRFDDPVTLPRTIPTGSVLDGLQVKIEWSPREGEILDAELRIVTDDPPCAAISYRVIGRGLYPAVPCTPNPTPCPGGPREEFGGRLRPRQAARSATFSETQTATFELDPNASHGLTAEIPSFLGGGSVQLSNFTGSVTLSQQPIPNDPDRAFIQIEAGSFTAPSVQLPAGLETGPNQLTFGPPEQSGGILELASGNYTAYATATIVNDLIPDGVIVRGNYSGVYNSQTGEISVQSDSEDLFPATGQLLNIATRMQVLTGDRVLIGGFIITGTDPKKVIIRGIGPSLSGVGVALSDPTLELFQGNTQLATNDNWKTRPDGSSQQSEIEATTIPPRNDLESALVATLSPGAYTAILAGKGQASGLGVMEIYDLAQGAISKLANISSRGFVDTGDNVMIGGVIVGGGPGGGNAKVIVRAIGPSLSSVGVSGALQDPTLELRDGNGALLVSNDNWKLRSDGSSQQAEIEATTIPPSDDRESALVASLPPGNSTAVVRGVNNAIGIAVVEAYNIP